MSVSRPYPYLRLAGRQRNSIADRAGRGQAT